MVLIEAILMNNCRLCHNNPGSHTINSDKKLIKQIYESVNVKVNDRLKELLPNSVCEECKETIKNFLIYKQQIRKIDQCLRKIIKNPDSKSAKSEHDQPNDFHDLNKPDNVKIVITCSSSNDVIKSEECGNHMCPTIKTRIRKRDKQIDVRSDDLNSVIEQSDDENAEKLKVKTKKKSNYICTWPNCHKILTSAYTLKTHELKHEGKRSFLCVTCGKGFITKNSLTCHEKIHLDVKAYTCKLCNINFSVRSNLRAHEKKHHEGVKFYCSQCTKAFSSKASLDRHERIHTGIKDFKCDSCTSAFYTNKELLKHKRYHQGLRLHKCDECFKTFFERHHLIIHLRSHTGERPYVCKVPNCGKSFMESQKLKRHHNAKHVQS